MAILNRFRMKVVSVVKLLDVAREAGVSHGTASNVFNNPEAVSKALREKVRAAASKLGYAGPDPRGRLLREGKSHAVAVMPPSHWSVAESLRNPIFRLFLEGVGEVCDEHGASLLVVPGNGGAALNGGLLADRLIFAREDQLEQVEAARLRSVPFVVVDFDHGPDANAVFVDARAGAYAAAKHLLDLGHRRFAIMSFLREPGPARLFAGPAERPLLAAGISQDQEKYLGYGQALREAGIDIATVPMVQADAYDHTAAALLLDNSDGATAVLSMSVMQALEVLTEARSRGLSVPRDLSVVGYNDIPEAAVSSPPLTTVDSRTREKAREAARLVFGETTNREIVLAPKLVIRSSTAAPPSMGKMPVSAG